MASPVVAFYLKDLLSIDFEIFQGLLTVFKLGPKTSNGSVATMSTESWIFFTDTYCTWHRAYDTPFSSKAPYGQHQDLQPIFRCHLE